MKFSKGFWMNKAGVTVSSPAEVRDLELDSESITVYAPSSKIYHRGQTLGGPLLTIRYSSPLPDVIHVQMYHFKGAPNKGPIFETNVSSDNKVEILNGETELSLTSGNTSVRINKKEWSVDFLYSGKRLTGSSHKSMGYITTNDNGVFVREQLDLDIGECVYGLGERFTPFVKNGQTVETWNEDGGTCSDIAYKSIPFYVTNKGYGVFVNHPGNVSYEVASEVVSRVQFSVPGEYLDYYIIGAVNPKEALQNYTALTGRPALPPAWSFGLWLTTSFTTNYDEVTVNSFIDEMARRDLPLHVFHFDCFWMKEYQWCDFEWDKNVFSDVANMLKRLKDKGLQICVWINPYIAQKSKLFDEGMKKGYLIKKADGSVWQTDMWQPGMGIVDFTNPEACKWFSEQLVKLMELGVDCFKTDFGERIPVEGVYFDGSDPLKMHNYYTYLYNKVVFEVLEKKKGRGNALVFARSATVGGQKLPVHWGGDCFSSYSSMAETLRGGLSLCLSGFGFWSHDISGFESTATADVYKRWVAFGLLSTHSRLHGNNSYRVPWLFDEEAVEVLRFFTKLKCSLMPYLFNTAYTASREGIPMMRAMVLEFCEDVACDYLDRQFMLGDSLLVAPIFKADGNVSYYLPKGCWTNFISGEKVEGGCWRHENHNYKSIPLMVRSNSIIAVGNENRKPDYDYAEEVTLHVFELQEGKTTSGVIRNVESEIELEVSIERCEKVVSIDIIEAEKPFSIILRGIHGISFLEGADSETTGEGIKLIPAKNANKIKVLIQH